MFIRKVIFLLTVLTNVSHEYQTKQKRDRFIDFLRFRSKESQNMLINTRKWTDSGMKKKYEFEDEDSTESDEFDRLEHHFISIPEPHRSEWKAESTPSTTKLAPKVNETETILNWYRKQWESQETIKDNQTEWNSRDYGYCYAYINASMLESLHGLEYDTRMDLLLTNDLEKSCLNPCANRNLSRTFNSTPIVKVNCGSRIVININDRAIYSHLCEPQLRVLLNQPIFIRHQIHWCVYVDFAYGHLDIPKSIIKEDDDDKENIVWPHRGNRFHPQWSPVFERCPAIDIRIDNQYFCELTDDDTVPDAKFFHQLDDDMKELFVNEMMNKVIDHDRIVNHYHFEHCNPFAFFYGHRRFLTCIEKILAKKSIPLPMWTPEIEPTIPRALQSMKYSPYACLQAPLCADGWLDIPLQVTTIEASLPIQLTPEYICQEDFFSLHDRTLEFHRLVHNTIGGTFRSFDSPASLLFYVFHNYIDKEIFGRWESCSKENFLFGKKQMSL